MNDSLNEKEIQKKVRREAFKRNWLLFRQSTLGMIGLGIVFFFFILAILQPILFMTGVWNEAVYHPVVGYEEIKVNLLVVECPDEYPTEKYESSNDCPGDGEITQRQIYNPNINPEVGDIHVALLQPSPPSSRHLLGTDSLGRDIFSQITKTDLSNENFPWLSSKRINVGLAPSIAMRMNFVGELGWELHHPIEYQNHIFDKLMEAGKDHGLKPFGIRAMESLRIEKTYKLVGTEMSIEYAAFESGLDRFVHLNKGNFIGRDSLVKWQQNGFKNKMVTLEVHDVEDADALGNNPIYNNGKVIGRATGGNYGFRVKKSLAIGMVEPKFADVGQKLEMDILDKKYNVTVIEDSPYDPKNEKLKQ